jgi:hypothetical protein
MGFDQRPEPQGELPAGTRDFARLYRSLPEEAEAIGWYEQRVAIETASKRPPPVGQARSGSLKPVSADLEIALLSFGGVNSAAEAFAAAHERWSGGASRLREVAFVERHGDDHLVLRGTFAGQRVDVDETRHVSERGAADGSATGTVIGALVGPPGLAVGTVAGDAIRSQPARPGDGDATPRPPFDRLCSAVPRPGSAIVMIAVAHSVDELLAVTRESGPRVIRKRLAASEAAALWASLRPPPAHPPGREQATDSADTATRNRPAK